jgi:hypothetical protein
MEAPPVAWMYGLANGVNLIAHASPFLPTVNEYPYLTPMLHPTLTVIMAKIGYLTSNNFQFFYSLIYLLTTGQANHAIFNLI